MNPKGKGRFNLKCIHPRNRIMVYFDELDPTNEVIRCSECGEILKGQAKSGMDWSENYVNWNCPRPEEPFHVKNENRL
jgi:hypothetical protein